MKRSIQIARHLFWRRLFAVHEAAIDAFVYFHYLKGTPPCCSLGSPSSCTTG
jgi:hypothetical protein